MGVEDGANISLVSRHLESLIFLYQPASGHIYLLH